MPGVSRSGATIVGGLLLGLDRPTAARVLVLSGDADDGGGVRARASRTSLDHGGCAALEIAVGFVDRRSSRRCRRQAVPGLRAASGFAPFAWYRIARRRSPGAGWPLAGSVVRVAMQWLRRSFIAGFFVTVPLFISVAAFVWLFGVVDGLTTPLYRARCSARDDPGLGIADDGGGDPAGRGGRDQRHRQAGAAAGESYLLRVPVFRTIYAPVKQLVVAFSPDNEFGFKRVVMLEDKQRVRARVPDEGVHGRSRARARGRWWRCTCPPTTCIWATS